MHNTKTNIFNILIPIILGSFATGAIADLPAGRYVYTAPEPTSTVSSSVTEYKNNALKWHDENAGSSELIEKRSMFGNFNQEETYTTRNGNVSVSGTSKFNPYTSEKEDESVSIGYDW
ncbi:hypothetical protein [Hafnia alvei]|uniref:hypothetical protein n=1 Tax=Hafnia alvei TaxID=569 RepID=UPI000A6BE718|nr:hypothetical protein [Hafnia alvei]MDU7484023.1 hypothetical protein [Hafnia alvei]